jgi:3-hydroxyisobutyrate dehydrogenase
VAFIGLGNIGAPIAQRLLDWDEGLVVVDVVDAAAQRFVKRGASRALSGCEAAVAAPRVCVMVNTEQQVRSVLDGPDGIWAGAAASGRSDTLVAVLSTISLEGARSLAAESLLHGVTLIDAPVSGGAMGAAEGTLAVMAGGPVDAVDAMRPVFERFASLVVRFGDTGAGTLAKIVRNLVTFASFAAAGEALRLADAAGLDLMDVGDIVRHSDAVTGGVGAIMLRSTSAPLETHDGLYPIFEHTVGLGLKDLQLAIELGRAFDLETPFAELAVQRLPSALGLPSAVGQR